MATFIKRGDRWQAQIRRKGYPTKSKSFTLKAHAEAWARKEELGLEAISSGYTKADQQLVKEVFIRYRDEITPMKKGERWESIRLDCLIQTCDWMEVPANKLDPADLRAWRDERLTQVSGSSVNREMNVISAVFGHAIKEGWISLAANPISMVKRPPSSKPRTQRVTDAQLESIVGPMPNGPTRLSSDYVPYAAWFAVETAMRQGEICQLTWSDIDVANRTVFVKDEWSPDNPDAKKTKNGTSREVPLSSRACALLNSLSAHNEDAPMDAKVFAIDKNVLSALWRRLANEAGMDHIHFHDLRREATTRMAPKLGNVMELSAVTGHRDLKVLMATYYAPKASDMAARLG